MPALHPPYGVFCLEGDWDDDLRSRSTVEPIFALLNNVRGYDVPYVHRNVATPGDLARYLEIWRDKRPFRAYPILYLGFHGGLRIGTVQIDGRDLSLSWFRNRLAPGGARGRMIFFSSCETLAVEKDELDDFIVATGCLGVVGYRSQNEWMESAVLDLYFLAQLQNASRFTGDSILRAARKTSSRLRGLFKDQQFEYAVRVNRTICHR